jgi:DNA-binding protein HU-beta
MNKTELVKGMAKSANLTQKAAASALDVILNEIHGVLAEGESIVLPGFGTFKVSFRSPRVCKNLKTGEDIMVPAKSVPVFTPSKVLKESVK